jgi:putative transcription antitermination factor YqgF
VAISDESAKFAFPYAVLNNTTIIHVINTLKKIIDGKDIVKIVLGQSLDFKGQPNIIMKRINNFKIALEEKLNIPIEFESEALTTRQAKRPLQEKHCRRTGAAKSKFEKIHASAAALILQSYLDRQNLPR